MGPRGGLLILAGGLLRLREVADIQEGTYNISPGGAWALLRQGFSEASLEFQGGQGRASRKAGRTMER